ncbi:hypothetical protein Amet_3143 [Alkaliphilus metalliredigens QYMF]|uniref:DUF4829 domain-containing protein n=1 Tax=Alkaliphilus metalliredigens (strain QYMF) TaxID=293826 RepID=A6TSW4_ALKMQ|nr:hypothetical protein [Alkaliphilus metalliredigens]ABR49282.1 hypothetical protein Amet_3143 [Alkaliphilus metalliredigens QYMF]
MKKGIIFFLLIILLFVNDYEIFAFLDPNGGAIENIQEEFEFVFQKRTEIWNGIIHGQYGTKQEFERDLKNLMVDPLLTMDLNIFEQILREPTSYEAIRYMEIKEFTVTQLKAHNMVGEVTIFWEVESYEDVYVEEVTYEIQMRRKNQQWYLADYEIK